MNDQDLRKLLKEIGDEIVNAIGHSKISPGSPVAPEAEPRVDGWSAWQKRVAVIAGLLVILGGLFGGLKYIISAELKTAFEQPNKDFASLRDSDIGGMKKDIHYLRRDLDQVIVGRIFNPIPGDKKTGSYAPKADEVKNAAVRAKDSKIPVSLTAIQKVSAPILQDNDPATWDAAMALVNLRSFVNSTLAEARQNVAQVVGPDDHGKWFQGKRGQWTQFQSRTLILDAQSQDEVPHLNDAPDHPASVYQYIIFKRCYLIYRGRKITLVNVFFDDCTFDIRAGPNGIMLAKNILATSPFTTFTAN